MAWREGRTRSRSTPFRGCPAPPDTPAPPDDSDRAQTMPVQGERWRPWPARSPRIPRRWPAIADRTPRRAPARLPTRSSGPCTHRRDRAGSARLAAPPGARPREGSRAFARGVRAARGHSADPGARPGTVPCSLAIPRDDRARPAPARSRGPPGATRFSRSPCSPPAEKTSRPSPIARHGRHGKKGVPGEGRDCPRRGVPAPPRPDREGEGAAPAAAPCRRPLASRHA